MLNMRGGLTGVLSLLLLAACGGGGGGSKDGGADNSWLSITPSPVSATTIVGVSAPLELTATSTKTISQTLYPVLVDTGGMMDPTATVITGLTPYSYRATLATSKGLPQGSYKGNIELWLYTNPEHTAAYPGSPWTIPYQIKVGPVRVAHKLLPNVVGVAFASTPGGNRLTQSIAIADNLGKSTSWQAVSDQSWLQVTATGTTGSPGSALILTADPTGLPSDVISYATVTLSSTDSTVQPIDPIKVGCWKGTQSAQRTDVVPILPIGGDHYYSRVCADPIRPYVYLTYGNQVYGTNSGNIVDCYNIYTATKVWSYTLPDIIGNAGSMAVAPDGSALYVLDYAGYVSGLYKFQLSDSTPASPTYNGWFNGNYGIRYVRPNGVGVIVTSQGGALLASTGRVLSATGFEGGLAPTADSEMMYVGNGYTGPGAVTRHTMDFSEFGGGTLVTRALNASTGTPENGFSRPIALSNDGARLYWISPLYANTGLQRLDPVTLSVLAPFSNPNEYTYLRMAKDGRLIASTQNQSDGRDRLRVFGPDDNLLTTLECKNPTTGEYFPFIWGDFEVSSDSMVVVMNTAGGLHFFPIYP
jgi:hypothetical protein